MSTETEIPQGEFADEDSPEQVAQPDDPQEYGENNRQLPESLRLALDGLVKKFQARDMYDRRIEVLTDRILRFYDDGVQHVYPNYGTGVYQIGTAGGYVNVGNGMQIECPEFMGAYNIFRSRRRSLDAVLTQNPPGVDFVPDRPAQPEDIEAAETAEGYRHFFDQNNNFSKDVQPKISRMFELSGRCVAWTHTVASKSRFGENDAGEPRNMEVVDVYGTIESKVPIACNSFENAPYVFLYNDLDVLMAKSENDWIKDKITAGEAGLGESDWERFARLGIRQAKKGEYLTGLALSYLVTEMHVFLRPSAFWDKSVDEPYAEAKEDDVTEDGKQFTIADKLRQIFPEGCHVKYIGKSYSESWNESPDDVLDIGFPVERDGMSGGALMEPMKVVQDTFNDYMNAKRQNYETGWSARFFFGSDTDYQAITDVRSRPNNFILLKEKSPDLKMEQIIQSEPPSEPPPGFDAAIEELRGPISQDITGALPALQGTSNHETTAAQQSMDRSQAMGMLGPAWANIQRMAAGIYKKAALLASKNPDHGSEIVVVGGDGKNISVKLEKLQKGKFHAHVSDSSFPETTTALRANLQELLKLAGPSPIGQTIFQSPDNWEQILELNGNPDLVLTPALAYKKQTRELEILLREPPIIPTPEEIAAYNTQHAAQTIQAITAGMPPPPYQPPVPEPSLKPEKDDYHQWESEKCKEYLSSEDCWIRQNVGEEQAIEQAKAGVMNVRLHKALHDQYMAEEAMAKAQAMQQIKPPSESINFKDEDPAGRQAMNNQAGIKEAAPEAQVGKKAAAPGTPGTGTV